MPEPPPSRSTNKPRSVTLRVKTSAETRRTAAHLAREYSHRRLESVLAAFVADLAVAAARPGSWEHERVSGWLASHVWECERKN
jgi:hypothetical protein